MLCSKTSKDEDQQWQVVYWCSNNANINDRQDVTSRISLELSFPDCMENAITTLRVHPTCQLQNRPLLRRGIPRNILTKYESKKHSTANTKVATHTKQYVLGAFYEHNRILFHNSLLSHLRRNLTTYKTWTLNYGPTLACLLRQDRPLLKVSIRSKSKLAMPAGHSRHGLTDSGRR